jgi:hypothetical protein
LKILRIFFVNNDILLHKPHRRVIGKSRETETMGRTTLNRNPLRDWFISRKLKQDRYTHNMVGFNNVNRKNVLMILIYRCQK